MLKELALLVSLLALFADARPLQLEETVEMSDEVEQNSDSLTNRDDILEGKDRQGEIIPQPPMHAIWDTLLYNFIKVPYV